MTLLAGSATLAESNDNIEVKQIDAIIRDNPLSGGANAAIVDSIRAGGALITNDINECQNDSFSPSP